MKGKCPTCCAIFSSKICFSLVVNIVFKNSNKDRINKWGVHIQQCWLLLALWSGVTPSGAQEQMDGVKLFRGVSCVQGKGPICGATCGPILDVLIWNLKPGKNNGSSIHPLINIMRLSEVYFFILSHVNTGKHKHTGSTLNLAAVWYVYSFRYFIKIWISFNLMHHSCILTLLLSLKSPLKT